MVSIEMQSIVGTPTKSGGHLQMSTIPLFSQIALAPKRKMKRIAID